MHAVHNNVYKIFSKDHYYDKVNEVILILMIFVEYHQDLHLKEYVFEHPVVGVLTNQIYHEQYLNNNQVLIDQIYAKSHVEQLHHDKNLQMNL
jgi:hypothetical protein